MQRPLASPTKLTMVDMHTIRVHEVIFVIFSPRTLHLYQEYIGTM